MKENNNSFRNEKRVNAEANVQITRTSGNGCAHSKTCLKVKLRFLLFQALASLKQDLCLGQIQSKHYEYFRF